MPQSITCDRCGALLYSGMELISPFEILQLYDGKCPKCHRKLSPVPIRVQVRKLSQEAPHATHPG